MSGTLTRPEFDLACQAYARDKQVQNNAGGWIWHEHHAYPLGFMSRRVAYRASDAPLDSIDDSLEDLAVDKVDDQVVAGLSDTLLLCDQHVCYSVTYQVPVFYFNIYASDGTPLTLARLLSTPLIKGANLPTISNATPFALTPDDSSFPLLSQGDHPTLGTPSWYLHPCESSAAVAELLEEDRVSDDDDDDEDSRWLRAWFAVLSTVVDLRGIAA